jgi:hypothetical protein
MAYSLKDKKRLFDEIIRLISIEGFSLRKALRVEGMPDSHTFYSWLEEPKEEGEVSKFLQYTQAGKERAEMMFEDILEICDATENDIILDKDGDEITNHNVIQRDRLRVDSRKWMLGKMMPKKYNDKYIHVIEGDLDVKHSIFNIDLVKNVSTDDGSE